jgi:hypothetical protein
MQPHDNHTHHSPSPGICQMCLCSRVGQQTS